jgi:hypothetical protein
MQCWSLASLRSASCSETDIKVHKIIPFPSYQHSNVATSVYHLWGKYQRMLSDCHLSLSQSSGSCGSILSRATESLSLLSPRTIMCTYFLFSNCRARTRMYKNNSRIGLAYMLCSALHTGLWYVDNFSSLVACWIMTCPLAWTRILQCAGTWSAVMSRCCQTLQMLMKSSLKRKQCMSLMGRNSKECSQ